MVEVCTANIGPRERLRRLRSSFAFAAIGLAGAAAMLALGTPRPWRLILLAPFWIAGSGVFQYLEKT